MDVPPVVACAEEFGDVGLIVDETQSSPPIEGSLGGGKLPPLDTNAMNSPPRPIYANCPLAGGAALLAITRCQGLIRKDNAVGSGRSLLQIGMPRAHRLGGLPEAWAEL